MNIAHKDPMPEQLEDLRSTKRTSSIRSSLFLWLSVILVIAGYVWFITYGYWTIWNPSTHFYDNLATAFLHGSLALDVEVSPELLALENPYSPFDRKGIDIPLDYSLYQGKYYLYFGPVPALLLVIPKLLGAGLIGDHLLVFTFICMMFLFESLIIWDIHKLFFRDIPDLVISFCFLFIGLVSPIAWMLTEARVYEAAITAGQAFFLAGFYFNFTAIIKKPASAMRLFIGGGLWAMSLGSRLILIVPIAFGTLVILAFIIHNSYPWRQRSKTAFQIISLCLPMIVGVLLLGWYNYARFNSVFETGFYYQLTSKNLQKYVDVLFSPLYILPNTFEYLVGRPKFLTSFPFLQPIRARGSLHFPFITLPAIYWTSALTGIIYSTPFSIFAGLPIVSIIKEWLGRKKISQLEDGTKLLYLVMAGLLASALAGFSTVTSFFWVAARYFTDFSPSIILLSIIGFFLGYRFLNRWPVVRSVYLAVGIGLMSLSIINSNLLVLAQRAASYQDWNPHLWEQLNSLFMR